MQILEAKLRLSMHVKKKQYNSPTLHASLLFCHSAALTGTRNWTLYSTIVIVERQVLPWHKIIIITVIWTRDISSFRISINYCAISANVKTSLTTISIICIWKDLCSDIYIDLYLCFHLYFGYLESFDISTICNGKPQIMFNIWNPLKNIRL